MNFGPVCFFLIHLSSRHIFSCIPGASYDPICVLCLILLIGKCFYSHILTKLSFCFWHFCIAFLVRWATTLWVLLDDANLCQSSTLWFITKTSKLPNFWNFQSFTLALFSHLWNLQPSRVKPKLEADVCCSLYTKFWRHNFSRVTEQ